MTERKRSPLDVGPVATPEALQERYRTTNDPTYWRVAEPLARDAGIVARDRSARMIAEMSIEDAAPLNGSLEPARMEELVSGAERLVLGAPLGGVGMELGAGIGTLSAVVAKRPGVQCVLAVEICRNFVDLVIPRVSADVLGDGSDRVVPVLGSFDAVELPDESLDFVVEIDSFHHAHDLDAVLDECCRVLKPGARLLCFDRAQPDDLSDEVRERMLDRVYDSKWVARNGYPPGISMTRRENGEHEIRLGEWLSAFERAGFLVDDVVLFQQRIDARTAMKSALHALPRPLRTKLVSVPVHRGLSRAWLASLRRTDRRIGWVALGPKNTTAFALTRA